MTFFDDSNIIDQQDKMYRSLLYFNLPKNIIEKAIRPNKEFHCDLDQPEEKDISNITTWFGQLYNNKNHQLNSIPNIVLMEVVNENSGAEGEVDLEQINIIGGYASDGWVLND
jgi:hypothetical protein